MIVAWYAPWRAPRPIDALVASACVMDSDLRAESVRRRHMDWQDRSLVYTEKVPEVWYATLFYARALPKLRFIAAEQSWNADTGEVEIAPTKDQKARDELKRLLGAGGGMSRFLEKYGQLQYATGEGYAVGMKRADDTVEEWTFRSHQEVRIKPGSDSTYQLLDMPGAKPEEISAAGDDDWKTIPAGSAIVARFWRPSMRHSWLADSPMRPALDTAEEILLLTQSIHARATSRAAGPGILYVPQSVASQVPAVDNPSPDEQRMPPLMQVLSRGMMTPIQNPNHATAVVPILLTGPDDAGEKIKHITLYDNATEWPEIANRKASVERLAAGSDFPIEYLTGLSDTNHWNAWEISDDIWQMHLQPVAITLANDLADALWRPMLQAAGIADPSMYCLMVDESEIVTRADKTTAAKDGYTLGIVNGAAYRREAGFDDDDQMDDEEYKRWVGVQMKDKSMATGGEITEPPPPPVFGHPQPPAEDSQGQAPPEPAPENGNGNGKPPAPVSESARLLGAAEMAVTFAREKAGSRVAQRARGCEDCRQQLVGITKQNIAATLGPDGLVNMPTAAELVAGAEETFLQTLCSWGVGLEASSFLAGSVNRHAAATLWDLDPVGVPAEVVGMVEGGQSWKETSPLGSNPTP